MDACIVLASLVVAVVSSSWCVLALLEPHQRGLFVCKAFGPARIPLAGKRGLAWKCASWLLDGRYEWTVDPFLAASSHPLEEATTTQQKMKEIKSDGGDWLFPHACGSLFTSMKPMYFRHLLLDMVTNMVVGILAAIPAIVAAVTNADNDPLPVRNACNGALHASTAVQLLFAVVYVTERPVAVRSELISGASMACLGCLGALNALLASVQATSLASAAIDDWGNGLQSLQLVVSAVAIIFAAVECLASMVVFGRRRSVQTASFVAAKEESGINFPSSSQRDDGAALNSSVHDLSFARDHRIKKKKI
ncbi:membrane-associated protein, putative [Bodo saltans]|uniref:Membrane-associated protein, putative n=1 Tax=Bodo saltans TaxID=75058 RepID=A0A0S4JL64_BODSA|nr:membrane-associated protein, putative [Bodo saltans]|eukprot:CUG90154.1 membrane-associated protein, putative [Bodo saltans]